jgi:hypothetical protein
MIETEEFVAATRTATLAAIASFAFGVLLHVDRLPLWCVVIAVGAIGFRIAAEFRHVRVPGRIARALLALLVVMIVLGRFRTLNGLAAGTALLALMGALKLFELEQRRDRLIVVAVALVLLLAACLERQGLLRIRSTSRNWCSPAPRSRSWRRRGRASASRWPCGSRAVRSRSPCHSRSCCSCSSRALPAHSGRYRRGTAA